MRLTTRSRGSWSRRRFHLEVDALEVREVLSTLTGLTQATQGPLFSASGVHQIRPLYEFSPRFSGSPPAGAFTPAQIQAAYGFNQISFNGVKGDGTGQTIAIVDAYDDPNIQADLNAFSTQFGLPSTTITRVGQSGGAVPGTDSSGGWELEIALDVEWAHAVAPGAKILLVEASSPTDSNLLAAVDYAAAHANVVSMSWGGSEFSGEQSASYENHFIHSGVTFVASSGDSGAPASWPAVSPNVLAVGGTALYVNSNGTWSSESGWGGSGGGPSSYEAKPAYQNGVVTQTTNRANPDVAYAGSPSTGFAVYDTFAYNGSNLGWLSVGGTSAGAPQWAALIAIADQGRSLTGQAALNSAGSQEVATILYKNATTSFHDITSGTSTGSPFYNAGTGYDYVTGIGSPIANLVIQNLTGTGTTTQIDHLVVTGATTDVAGDAINVTVTAYTPSNTIDTVYTGTVALTGSDARAVLGGHSFVNADGGSYTFSVTLKTAGTQSVTATDTSVGVTTGTLSGISVSPAAASQFVLSGLSWTAIAGASQGFTLTAKDAYGNVATGYNGTVHFTSSDSSANLPSDYTFTGSDGGSHAFFVAFATAGTQSLTATGSGLTVTQSGITVSPAAPINLSAASASNTAVNLSWTGASGASTYLIERSLNGTSGWSQIGTSNSTTYQDTGLTAGTTYWYRVRAAGGNVNSAYSNVASVTTTGASANNSLWANSYVPSIDYYGTGSYDIGEKIKTDVAGTVSALRFYKQTWMNGYAHVGYLWSSTGSLLAMARFTNETASGWQQVTLSNPVAITANTVYIVSFSTGGGYFGINSTGLSGSGVDNGPLHALANGVSGGNGVYSRGNSSFPTNSGGGMEFFADLVFNPSSSGAVTGHKVVSTTGSTANTGNSGTAYQTATLPTTGTTTVSIGTQNSAYRQAATPTTVWSNRGSVFQAATTSSKARASWFA